MASAHSLSTSNSSSSPPLPNMHSLSISPFPSQGLSNSDYRYNGVFGPPSQDAGWNNQNKRTSRNGLPTNWYDPSARESQTHSAFDSFRRDSPPALSPPSSTTSAPTTSSSQQPYAYPSGPGGFPDSMAAFSSMGVSPSPPPLGYGIGSGGYNVSALPQYGSQQLPPPSHSRGGNNNSAIWSRNGYGGGSSVPPLDDDVIPTAIVIKNIPFAVAREHLLGVIESLGAPLPYAFNYHHDNGIFRGLAFANFRAPDEAASVVAALNGYDVQGRKLRVEYKKVLQPGEKDKIEREKALKRMRSIQFDQAAKDMPPPLNIPSHNRNNLSIGTQQQNGRLSAELEYSPPHSASSATSENLPMSLDLNDPVALDIYSRVLVFKEDRMRDELAFSKSLNPTERRIVHLVAQKLGLTSITKGDEGEIKYVVVTRESHRPPLNSASSATAASSSTYLSPYSAHQTDMSPSLRIKKSMPDLRGFNGPVVARDPTRSLNPQRSSGNLRGEQQAGGREYVSMGAAGGRRVNGYGSGNFNSYFGAPVDNIPPVPPLPTNLSSHQSRSSMSTTTGASGSSPDSSDYNAAPLRNPRGPAGDNTRGFGGVRHSASAILRGSSAHGGASSSAGSLSLGRRVSEEDDGLSQSQTLERLRSRESAVEV